MVTRSTTLLKRQKAGKRKTKRQKSLFPLCMLILSLICSLIFLVWSRSQITSLGYQISQANYEQTQLLKLNQKLKIEGASLRSLARIESIAKEQLGLINPEPQQMVFIK
jgi:cell division protein FtsL